MAGNSPQADAFATLRALCGPETCPTLDDLLRQLPDTVASKVTIEQIRQTVNSLRYTAADLLMGGEPIDPSWPGRAAQTEYLRRRMGADPEPFLPEDPLDVVAGVLVEEDRVLLGQRHYDVNHPEWSEKWCLPGGKVESGESFVGSLHREWLEEVDCPIHVGPVLHTQIYRTPNFPRPYRVTSYLVRRKRQDRPPRLLPAGGQAIRWTKLDSLLIDIPSCLPSTFPPLRSYRALFTPGV